MRRSLSPFADIAAARFSHRREVFGRAPRQQRRPVEF
jgi:hypothetical protein